MENNTTKNIFKSFLSPVGLVLLLTLMTFITGYILMDQTESDSSLSKVVRLLAYWQEGFFSLLGFTLQMIMILVFGYALAVFAPINRVLKVIAGIPKNLTAATLLTAVITSFAGILNWGFGLIVGAILARFVHESLISKGFKSNSALLASTGYLGMAVWHGGLSASAPLTVAGKGHFLVDTIGIIPVSETLFSSFNVWITSGLISVFLITTYVLSKTSLTTSDSVASNPLRPIESGKEGSLARGVGLFMILVMMVGLIFAEEASLGMITLNWVNFLLFSLVLIAYKSWERFSLAVGQGLKTSSDILIQFPFYAGILGLLSSSGALYELSQLIQSQTSKEFFPLITFFSTAFVNLLVPSGGGQWAIQGPVIMETAANWGLNFAKLTMIFAYGDQISNLLQPFWALPLLSITGVPVRKLLPYCAMLFLSGFVFLTLAIWWMY